MRETKEMQTINHNGPIDFAGFTCLLYKTTYTTNGTTALVLLDLYDGSLVLTVTANVTGASVHCLEDEVLVKDHSENEGIMDVLVDAGYLERTGKDIPSGFAYLTGARILSS